ncbi:hypothetical protein I2485_07310 [Nesterenkonia sp. E16_7]|uniref:DUF4350 domain-containing protein n=1 Tax=unclassified Nesterenkonia TaxID=2629769 RepID=UPI001A9146F0|nr:MULTISPECIES: DUF4350 domain-containing protein [unclassified Nesterenkonia]MBO0594331.1 hypothetical protein [Nesterenkonia sp. E16_10]MBO0598459.1 hypothetical protein [Nesterenkonia sp. E16_7]
MTTTTATLGSTLRSGFQRWQFWLLLLVLGLLSVALIQSLNDEDMDRFGLQNTALDGYAALAGVLEDQEVQIHSAASAEIARDLMTEHPEAPLVVLSTGDIPEAAFSEGLRGRDQRPVVLLSEGPELLGALYPEGPASYAGNHPGGGSSAALEAGAQCPVDAAVNAATVQAPGALFFSDAPGCFTGFTEDTGAAQMLIETEAGLLFGGPAAFTNQNITDAGHAALALWLFGAEDDLIWYTPMGLDTLDEQQWASPMDFLPDWVIPLAWWLLLCVLVMMLVLGRRPGPVVGEPLPVQVPGAETAEGRGRMYQSANAVDASARTLRSAHLIRLARLLRLGAAPQEASIVDAAARQIRRDPAQLEGLLARQPRSNSELVAYAQALAQLEDEVQRAALNPHSLAHPAGGARTGLGAEQTSTDRTHPNRQQGKNTSND